ncbi:hypothetical protein [Marinobacter nauticus]|uniref:hypothetical protein n=1 Tax=Marinobacter nauticus TaxID=2743 RepID=UPI003736CC3F
MNSREIVVYLNEAETQCRMAIVAVIALNNAMQADSKSENGTQDWDRFRFIQGEIFRSLHSLLTHASNISRIFWPPVGRGQKAEIRGRRGVVLRQKVGLPDEDHPLHKRTLRDHLEHFDERIDHWRETSIRKNYAQDLVGPKGMIAGFEETDMMRWYDPERKCFMFRGEEFDIQELVTAIEALRPMLSQVIEREELEARRGASS